MPGTLFIVATPIGNLEDVSFRSVRILKSVKLIAAEDTRRTALLLQHYGVGTPTTSFHEHNEREKLAPILGRLAAGDDVALVSDAGTPGISDPGFRLVRAALEEHIRIEAIPGPSAVITALVASGMPTDAFSFVGFPPPRQVARKVWFQQLAAEPRTVVFFEAPHRVRASLRAAHEALGPREVAVGRELTKLHEQWLRGTIPEVLEGLERPRGEFTIVVAPPNARKTVSAPPSDQKLWEEFVSLGDTTKLSRRQTVAALADRHGLSHRYVYRAIERIKGGG
jgi:16S rRNA (cytidine1402-2'-O)-methyltransferase